MDRYYTCGYVNGKNYVQCTPISISDIVKLDPNTIFNVYGDLPRCLDPFFFMRKFQMPVKIAPRLNS